MSAASCPWCIAFKLFEISGAARGVVPLPLSALPAELCEECRLVRRSLASRSRAREDAP